MFTQIFLFCMVCITTYILIVFTFPDFSDKYGSTQVNTKFRDFKTFLEQDSHMVTGSLIQKSRDIAKPYSGTGS